MPTHLFIAANLFLSLLIFSILTVATSTTNFLVHLHILPLSLSYSLGAMATDIELSDFRSAAVAQELDATLLRVCNVAAYLAMVLPEVVLPPV